MKFFGLVLVSLLASAHSSPDFSVSKVEGKSSDEPNIIQFNIQCLDQPTDQVGSAAEETPISTSKPTLKDKLLESNPKLRSILAQKESGNDKPKLRERLAAMKRDKPEDLKNLLLSRNQDTVGSASADQPEVKPSLLPQLKEKLDTLKARASNIEPIQINPDASFNKLKEKLKELKEKDIVGAASSNLDKVKEKISELKQKPDVVGAPRSDSRFDSLKEKLSKLAPKDAVVGASPLDRVKERIVNLKEKARNADTAGAATQDDSPSIALPPESALEKVKNKLNDLKANAKDIVGSASQINPLSIQTPKDALEKVKGKLSELKNRARNQDTVGAAAEDTPTSVLDKMREKVTELKNKGKDQETVPVTATVETTTVTLNVLDKMREKIIELKNKGKEQETVGATPAAEEDEVTLPTDSPVEKFKAKFNELKNKIKDQDTVGSAAENSPSLTNLPKLSNAMEKMKAKLANLKEKNRDIVGAAAENRPSKIALPPPKVDSLDKMFGKIKDIKEKAKNRGIVGSSLQNDPPSATLEKMRNKLDELKNKARSRDFIGATMKDDESSIALPPENIASEKVKEKINNLKEKFQNRDTVGAASQNDSPSLALPSLEKMKQKLNDLKTRSRDIVGSSSPTVESPTISKLKEKLDSIKGKQENIPLSEKLRGRINNLKDTVGSASQNDRPVVALPALEKMKEKLKDIKARSRDIVGDSAPAQADSPTLSKLKEKLDSLKGNKRADTVGAASSNVLDSFKEKINDLKERSASIQKKLPSASGLIEKLRERTKTPDMVGAAQNIAARQAVLLPTIPTLPPADPFLADRLRSLTQLIPPIRLPTLEARLIPPSINFNPAPAPVTVLPLLAPGGAPGAPILTIPPIQLRDSASSGSEVDPLVSGPPMIDLMPSASKLAEAKNRLTNLAETIKARTADIVKPVTIKPSMARITSAVDSLKKKLETRRGDMFGSASRTVSKTVDPGASYAGITQKDVDKKSCDICSCLMKYLGKNEDPQVGASAPEPKKSLKLPESPRQLPESPLKKLRSRLRSNGDQSTMEDRFQPLIALPPLKKSALRNNDIVGSGAPQSLIPGNDDKENIRKLVEFASLVEELDDFLSKKTKSVIARLSKFIQADGVDGSE